MDEKKIQQIQDEILSGIDKEMELERQIVSDAEEISYGLNKRGKVTFVVDNREYLFQSKAYTNNVGKNCIAIYVTDIQMSKMAKLGDYRPFIVNSEADNDLSFKENLEATVEAFLRHRLGLIKPEVLSDDIQ